MIKPITQAAFTITTLLVLCGCGNPWPPSYEKLSTHFTDNERAFERLVEKMESSDYVRVVIDEMRGVSTPNDSSHVSGTKRTGTMSEPIIGDSEWSELFAQTGMFAIRSDSGRYEIDLPSRLDLGQKSITAIFVKGTPTEKYECAQTHKDLPCGKCYSTISQSWGIEYYWADRNISDELWKQVESGELEAAKYEAAADFAVHQCRTNGYAEIGYTYERSN